jgi:hypothetical protein
MSTQLSGFSESFGQAYMCCARKTLPSLNRPKPCNQRNLYYATTNTDMPEQPYVQTCNSACLSQKNGWVFVNPPKPVR